MPKRKRNHSDVQDEDPIAEQRSRVEKLIFQGKRELQHAIKVAKGFERPKLNRRLKQSQSGNDETSVSRIKAEIEAIKKIDNAVCAETHLYKVLLKVKSIAHHPALPAGVKVEKQELDAPSANVTARLYNYPVTKKAMEKVLGSIKRVLRIKDAAAVPKKKMASTAAHAQSPTDEESHGDADPLESSSSADEANAGNDRSEDGTHEFMELEDLDSDGQEKALDAFDARIAGSSDSEQSVGEETQSNDAASDTSFPIVHTKGRSISRSPPPPPSKKPKAKSRSAPEADTSSSIPHFVPSLQVGYISGSESSATDIEAEIAPRKNRRGQRARQAIWEKKYGSGAKHVRNAQQKGAWARDAGWDPKRGATGDDDMPFWKRKLQARKPPPGATADGANTVPLRKPRVLGQGNTGRTEKKSAKDAPLHPSWVAKQKAKEAQSAQFQGKKMTFD